MPQAGRWSGERGLARMSTYRTAPPSPGESRRAGVRPRAGRVCPSANAPGGRRASQAMHRLPRVQTAALQAVPEVAARRWQAEKAAQVAFFATALFAAQLYLSPAQWFPVLEPTHHAAILSAVALGALLLRRVLSNQPFWMGWRTALLAV